MADQPKFRIERVQNVTYLDEARNVVDGFQVTFRMLDFDEVRTVNVPTDDPIDIEAAALLAVERREALAALGQ